MSEIRNRYLMSQITDFKGMVYGRCRPTDIDLSIDFNKEVFIFTELKYVGTGLTIGQKIHLMGLVDAIEAGGRKAYAILAHHSTPTGEDIRASSATITSVYTKGEWHTEMEGMSLHKAIDTLHYAYTNRHTKENNQ